MYVLVGHKKYIQQWFDITGKAKTLWLRKLDDILTVICCLFFRTPILKVQPSILIKIILKANECCNNFELYEKLNFPHAFS